MAESAKEIDEIEVLDDLKYTESSEWIRVEGDLGRVGLSDYAQHELTDIVYVELPEIGAKITKGREFCVVESVKAVADVYAPVTGDIIEVNEELLDAPELINEDPYGKGWIAVVKLETPGELDKLMSPEAYRMFLKSRV